MLPDRALEVNVRFPQGVPRLPLIAFGVIILWSNH
jgi:hypothetical protein